VLVFPLHYKARKQKEFEFLRSKKIGVDINKQLFTLTDRLTILALAGCQVIKRVIKQEGKQSLEQENKVQMKCDEQGSAAMQ